MAGKIFKDKKAGFTLVEALIFSFIVVIVTVSFYRTFAGGAKVLSDARARIAAAQVANEKLEVLRNIPYENLTNDKYHEGGYIDSEEQTVTRSSIEFKVTTVISYVNDSYDEEKTGLADERPNDYKQIDVTVKWGVAGENKSILVSTHIAPPGTEALYNGGILNVEIRQSNGTPVQGANVDIRDANTNVSTYSGATLVDGKVYLIGLEEGDKKYKISVNKTGYESVVTMPPYNQTAYDPVDEHASVVLAGIWSQTIIFDPLATFNLSTVDPLGNPIGGIGFSLTGGRKLGDTVPGSLPVHFYAESNHQTDASGLASFEEKSPGGYIFEYADSAVGSNAEYDFWKVEPQYGGSKVNFFANPGESTDVFALLLPKNVPSLFLTVLEQTDATPISGAKVTVKNESLAYEQILETDQFGQVYFPKKETTVVPLQNVEYQVKVEAVGYASEETNITVSNLTKQEIQIHP